MKVNIGIIGTGNIADGALAPAINQSKNARLWSIASRDLQRAEAFSSRHQAESPAPAYDDIAQMLKDPELHGVIIATPDKLHGAQAQQALLSGKHVLVEKPICTNVAEAKEIIDCSEKMQRCLAVAYHLRWHAGHRAIRKMILDGFTGRIVHTRAQWSWKAKDGSNWRAFDEVGRWWSLAGVGTHCLDLIRWFMLPTCGEAACSGSTISTGKWGSLHDEAALVQLKFESGATAELHSSVLFDAPSRLEIYGENGFVICEGTLGRTGTGRIMTHQGDFEFAACNPFLGEIENFAESITQGSPPEVGGREGLRNIEILIDATRKSNL